MSSIDFSLIRKYLDRAEINVKAAEQYKESDREQYLTIMSEAFGALSFASQECVALSGDVVKAAALSGSKSLESVVLDPAKLKVKIPN